ncbi:GFA family protein [Devosia salina]|uniref:CENP-V/GFA domain-containing protein n=1 Tax=Devosia salina TaxID=2860336 RepID=A0ABX8WP96_9HYPH|nr:hypothetical protein [Devosia salina]QYO78712.1 hypothetical protein K1X15_09315 [Devosia salina]
MVQTTTLACQCGQFHIEVTGAPLITAECHCTSCRTAAQRLSALPPAFPLTDASGGVPYILYRKDRVRFPDGTANLAEFRLNDSAPTRRVVTICCNTPVFTEFQGGHWLSLFAGLWPEAQRPQMEIRTQTGDVPEGTTLDDSLPSGGMVTAGFYAKLLAAWIAMGFRVPKVEVRDRVNA